MASISHLGYLPLPWSTLLVEPGMLVPSLNPRQDYPPGPMEPTIMTTAHCYIMDNILALNLSKKKTIQLQSVCLFLKIFLLSEITNYTG